MAIYRPKELVFCDQLLHNTHSGNFSPHMESNYLGGGGGETKSYWCTIQELKVNFEQPRNNYMYTWQPPEIKITTLQINKTHWQFVM